MNLYDHGLVVDHNAEATEHIVSIEFGTSPPVTHWGLLFGDFVHNLRSALDHLVYAIAVHESDSDPPPNHRALMMLLKGSEQGFTDAGYRIETLSDVVRARIKSLQPYAGANNQLLGVLDDLDIHDKHRVLALVAVGAQHLQAPVYGLVPGTEVNMEVRIAPFKDKTPILTITTAVPSPDVQVHGEASFAIVLSHKGLPPIDVIGLGKLLRSETLRAIDVVLGRPAGSPARIPQMAPATARVTAMP